MNAPHRPLLFIVGPTATGKTSLAIEVIRHLKGSFTGFDLISADSRQVYKGMEVGTGASDYGEKEMKNIEVEVQTDITNDVLIDKSVIIWGTSLIHPDQEWSVAHFREYALPIIRTSWQHGRLPLVVGGTGLFSQRLFETDAQLRVPPNAKLRKKAEALSLGELQAWVQQDAPEKWQLLNPSDRANPRRLIRAIEVARSEIARSTKGKSLKKKSVAHSLTSPTPSFSLRTRSLSLLLPTQMLTIGLCDTLEHLQEKIHRRIHERLAQGMEQEVRQLCQTYSDWSLPAFSATGYKEVRSWLDGEIDTQTMEQCWFNREFQYAKRQITWWKKSTDVEWFDVGKKGWLSQALRAIDKALVIVK